MNPTTFLDLLLSRMRRPVAHRLLSRFSPIITTDRAVSASGRGRPRKTVDEVRADQGITADADAR